MKLYHCDRVVKIEASDDFRDAKQKADSRKRSARKAVQTKLKMLQEYLDNLTIEVPVMELEVLIEAARRNFYSLRYSSDVRRIQV